MLNVVAHLMQDNLKFFSPFGIKNIGDIKEEKRGWDIVSNITYTSVLFLVQGQCILKYLK